MPIEGPCAILTYLTPGVQGSFDRVPLDGLLAKFCFGEKIVHHFACAMKQYIDTLLST